METTRRKIVEVFPPLISQAEIDSAGDRRDACPTQSEPSVPPLLLAVLGLVVLSIVIASLIRAL